MELDHPPEREFSRVRRPGVPGPRASTQARDAAERSIDHFQKARYTPKGRSPGSGEDFFGSAEDGDIGKNMVFSPDLRLEARGLAIRRGFRLLFEGLDLDLASGEIVQLSGPNGAGKSTLMRILGGFSRADMGTIRWQGVPEDVETGSLFHYHGHREALREALTPRENLAFSAGLLGGHEDAIVPALEQLGAGMLADLPVQVLSAGQRRRVALARLLVAPRPLWLLDEPLAALDVEGQALVGRLIADHQAQGGMALVATHQSLGIAVRHLVLDGRGKVSGQAAAGILT